MFNRDHGSPPVYGVTPSLILTRMSGDFCVAIVMPMWTLFLDFQQAASSRLCNLLATGSCPVVPMHSTGFRSPGGFLPVSPEGDRKSLFAIWAEAALRSTTH